MASSAEPASPDSVVRTFDAEAPAEPLPGTAGSISRIVSTALSLYAIYWVLGSIETHLYRISFLLVALVLTFLHYPGRRSESGRQSPSILSWVLAAATIVALGWPLIDLDQFIYRAANPTTTDLICGTLAVGLVLEATRRTVGWILPGCAIAFLIYAFVGPSLDAIGLGLLAHRGYDLSRTIGTLYLTLDGLFGVPLDVTSTYIILFTLYGAVLQQSGAGTFFLDWSLSAMGKGRSAASPARATTLASLLLGSVSGSGVATTVTLGSVAWPLLARAGFSPTIAGAILASGGIGAILTPPTLGAAAFIIAEFLKISYFKVLAMATVPSLLYYLSIFIMIEADARRVHAHQVETPHRPLAALTREGWFHFASLVAMVALLAVGYTTFRAVFWAIVVAVATSYLRRENAMTPRRLLTALEGGTLGILPIAATTAAAGAIVGIVTLTGLGLKMAGLIVALAGGSLLLTVVFAATAVLLVGLAVPVTASYIIAAVMIAPALTQVGVSPLGAHMFVFYYAVLSEVSPPTALSPFAAAAITGGDPLQTMLTTWKYTLPAFLVPFAFTLSPEGMGILLQGSIADVVGTIVLASAGIAVLAAGTGGWLGVRLNPVMRAVAIAGGIALLFGSWLLDLL